MMDDMCSPPEEHPFRWKPALMKGFHASESHMLTNYGYTHILHTLNVSDCE